MKANLKLKREQAKLKHDEKDDNEEHKEDVVLDASKVRDYLASGCRDKSVKIWEVKNGRCVITLIGHDNWITDLCFVPTGRHLISVSDDKSLRCWDL